MAGILLRKSFAQKNMSQVAVAVGAHNLCPAPVRVAQSCNGPGYLVVETGPSATGIELGCGFVQRGITLFAVIDPWLVVLVVFSAKGSFGSLFQDHLLLFPGEFPVLLSVDCHWC